MTDKLIKKPVNEDVKRQAALGKISAARSTDVVYPYLAMEFSGWNLGSYPEYWADIQRKTAPENTGDKVLTALKPVENAFRRAGKDTGIILAGGVIGAIAGGVIGFAGAGVAAAPFLFMGSVSGGGVLGLSESIGIVGSSIGGLLGVEGGRGVVQGLADCNFAARTGIQGAFMEVFVPAMKNMGMNLRTPPAEFLARKDVLDAAKPVVLEKVKDWDTEKVCKLAEAVDKHRADALVRRRQEVSPAASRKARRPSRQPVRAAAPAV